MASTQHSSCFTDFGVLWSLCISQLVMQQREEIGFSASQRQPAQDSQRTPFLQEASFKTGTHFLFYPFPRVPVLTLQTTF